MNATLMVDSFTPEEQRQLLQALVDRLFPEPAPAETDAFPEWIMKELEEQELRIQAGLEKGEDWQVVKERLSREFLR